MHGLHLGLAVLERLRRPRKMLAGDGEEPRAAGAIELDEAVPPAAVGQAIALEQDVDAFARRADLGIRG